MNMIYKSYQQKHIRLQIGSGRYRVSLILAKQDIMKLAIINTAKSKIENIWFKTAVGGVNVSAGSVKCRAPAQTVSKQQSAAALQHPRIIAESLLPSISSYKWIWTGR